LNADCNFILETVVYRKTCRRLGWFRDCSHLHSH